MLVSQFGDYIRTYTNFMPYVRAQYMLPRIRLYSGSCSMGPAKI